LNNQGLGESVFVREKPFPKKYLRLADPFSGVGFRRPKDAFSLVFSSQGQSAREHQRVNIRE
jgi:hypothetical protein